MTKEFDKRNMAKSRRVCEDMEAAHVTKWLKLTERERQILAMWPRFEDGELVMIGDGVDGLGGEIIEVYIAENAAAIWNNFGHHMHLSLGERVKRPAPEVLDADGVLIKAGDTVWHEDGSELHVIGFGDAQDGETMLVVKYAAGPTKWGEVRCLSVTHTRPAPKVLDADGVEIKVGDTVYEPNGQSGIVTAVHPSTRCVDLRQDGCDAFCMDANRLTHACPVLDADGVPIHEGDTVWIIPAVTDTPDEPHEVKHINRWGEVLLEFHFERSTGVKGEYLTHTRPDSWERLYEDAADLDDMPCDFNAKDLIRRAKALAGIEVD